MTQQIKNSDRNNKNIFPIEKYAIRELQTDEDYQIMIVNTSLKDYQFKKLFPWILKIDIDTINVNQAGLPTDQEADILNILEDNINQILNPFTYQFIGRISYYMSRQLFYYVNKPADIHKEMQDNIGRNTFNRELEYFMKEDKSWSEVDFFFNYDNI